MNHNILQYMFARWNMENVFGEAAEQKHSYSYIVEGD